MATVTGQHARNVVWLISGHDFQEHAFYEVDRSRDFLEALCEHSVPQARLVDPNDTVLTPRRCVACLLIHGGDLADQHETDGRFDNR